VPTEPPLMLWPANAQSDLAASVLRAHQLVGDEVSLQQAFDSTDTPENNLISDRQLKLFEF
jgi:hypothetical protein